MSLPNLDDLTKTVVYVPHDESQTEDTSAGAPDSLSVPLEEADIPEGPAARLEAFRDAWGACLERVKGVVQALHAPLAREIVKDIKTAYDAPLPALPYPEIPAFAICASGDEFISDIAARLADEGKSKGKGKGKGKARGDAHANEEIARPARVVHLRPAQCSNIAATMKGIISGFVDDTGGGTEVKRKATTTSLAAFDIHRLRAWYDHLRSSLDDEATAPVLVVFMHDFEQYDTDIVADMFSICSSHIPNIPLVFVLALLSPPSPSFIHQTYRRSTLSLLRLEIRSLPRGPAVLENILLETFFALDFEPVVMPGPATIAFLTDFFMRHTPSLDSIYTILKLAHLRHFEDPLTLLVYPTKDMKKRLSSQAAVGFLTALVARVAGVKKTPRTLTTVEGVSAAVDDALARFSDALFRLRVALRLFLRVRSYLVEVGRLEENGAVPMLLAPALEGDLSVETDFLAAEINKAPPETIAGLRLALGDFADDVPDPEGGTIKDALGALDPGADVLAEFVSQYCEDNIVDLSAETLADVWFMGSTPFPSELVNPAPRSTVLAGLSDPYAFAEATVAAEDRPRRALWQMPDTTILFRRYVEAGRMVNVYDWYESFALVLDRQREQMRRIEGDTAMKSKGKGKEKATEEDVDADDDVDDEDEERWKMHVQARFMRALHELDFLGLVKHTGRKADHVLRTVYDGAD